MNQSKLIEHDKEAFIVYYKHIEKYERYGHTAERFARIHSKKYKPPLKRVVHMFEDGRQIKVTELFNDKKEK
jgi:hypothetical protein